MLVRLKEAIDFDAITVPVGSVYIFATQDSNGVLRLFALDSDKQAHPIEQQVFSTGGMQP